MKKASIAHYLEPDKKAQSVQEHLEEVSAAASFFAGKIGLPSMGRLAGLLHDFGKYSSAFQRYIRSAEGILDPDTEPLDADKLKGKIDHATAGAQKIWQDLRCQHPISSLVAQAIALCIASHHSRSGLIDCLSPDGADKFSARMAKQDEKTHLDEARRLADQDVLAKVADLLSSLRDGEELKRQLDRLFCGEDSREVREFYVGLLVRFLYSALIDADRLSAAGRISTANLHARDGHKWDRLTDRIERHIAGIEARNWVDELRSGISLACLQFASHEKGLYQLTVPTGGAKTLSSLRFGLHHASRHQMERLIYVVPYTTIIDQNAAVARLALEELTGGDGDPVVLEHHSNLTPEKETPRSRLLAENWDATVIFTTTVQFLETLFAGGTRGVRRLHRLANAVIVFDEIQTLPIKTIHLFNNAINFLVKQCGSTVVLCTATQPLLHGVDPKKGAARLTGGPDKSEMAPHRDDLFEALRRVEVIDGRKNGGWSEAEIVQCICNEAKEAGSALAIVNTKAAARRLHDLCRQQVGNVFHLSTYMCPAHRMKIISEIRKKLDPENTKSETIICVSTQLIEAGVDVDFGSVVRSLAGLDSIAQAAGRCNRNGRRPSGRVLVVNPSHESLTMLPDIEIGKEITQRILDEYRKDPDAFDSDLLSPKAMLLYYKYYFFSRSHEMAYRVSAKEIGHDDDLFSLLSTNVFPVEAHKRASRSAPPLYLRQSFKSAGDVFKVIDAPTEGVIVPYGEEGKRIIAALCAVQSLEETRKLLRDAQRYSVNLFPRDMEKLIHLGCSYETQKGSGIFYLDERYYSKDMGVAFEVKEGMGILNG